MKKSVFTILALFVGSSAFANGTGKIDPKKPLYCYGQTGQQYVLSAPNANSNPHKRNVSINNAKPITLEFCKDTSADDALFGSPGGVLACFDQMASAKYNLTVVLADGMEGQAGSFRWVQLNTMSVDTGTCQSQPRTKKTL